MCNSCNTPSINDFFSPLQSTPAPRRTLVTSETPRSEEIVLKLKKDPIHSNSFYVEANGVGLTYIRLDDQNKLYLDIFSRHFSDAVSYEKGFVRCKF